MYKDQLWNDDWQFCLTENDALSIENIDGESFTDIEVPHDWLIGDTRNLYRSGDGWYRKRFSVTEEMLNGKVFVGFDGVYNDCTVYVNKKPAGDWKYGYSSFCFDVTELLSAGENVIHVAVRYKAPNSRWYSGAGIYRSVYLRLRNKAYIENDGVYISPRPEGGSGWKVYIETEKIGGDRLVHTIEAPDGRELGSAEGLSCSIEVKDPVLWDIYKGNLYTLKSVLYDNGEIADVQENVFGFRSAELDPQKGFIINGRREKLHGVCMHHDLGALGAAMNEAALRRQLEILKGFGVNAIRTSHNMPARELVRMCNEMGILLDSECFDMWESPKTEFDYARFFPEWYKTDIKAWVRRDRNSPAVIMWSIGNEIGDTHASPRGLEVAKMLKEAVLEHDPKGNAVCTIASNYMPWENAQKVADYLKQGGYNYAEHLYEEHHQKHPDWFIYGSETSSAVRSRGIYHLPASADILTHDDLQCSDMGNSCVSWGRPMDQAWIMDRDSDFCGGQFVWTGFDYIGEPTPYSTKNSYFGIVDTAGLFKEAYYFYRAVWTDGSIAPFVHILPAWDFNEGQEIEVRTYSNLEDVELFFNGESLGRQHIDLLHGKTLYGSWKLKYAKGELVARAYNENGTEAAFDRKASFGEAAELVITPEKTSLKADGRDLIFLRIGAVDEKGEPVANARNRIRVEVSGAGRLVGLDSGDSTDYDSYKGNSKRLFGGMITAIVGSVFESGDINIAVSSEGLPTARLVLTAAPCEREEGVSAPHSCFPVYVQPEDNSISARKIELSADRTALCKEAPSAEISAAILPSNASFKDITWRCILENGIDSPIAELVPNGGRALVTARGDGSFILRAMCSNGKNHPEIVSDLYFTAEGLGDALTDPYSFVSASLWSFSNLTPSVVDKGAVSRINERTVIGFDNIDFGSYGSDRLTLYVGNGRADAVEIQLWKGNPDNADTKPLLLDTLSFAPNNGWDRFMPADFELPERLKGITSISFVISKNCIFGGFEFKKLDRSRAKLQSAEYDSVYGDDFVINENRVERIGNNVVIGFKELDFGAEGVTKITVRGRTSNPVNSVQLRYTPKGGNQITQLAEFEQCGEYTERTFELDPIRGEVSELSFVFMPGSDFDFDWFRFE
ncbi:MAG: DUF4982 domain-containing protein [Bacteroides sp.]|nr:DUF4982 domain-containing protein [Bacteroides sp.]